MVEKDYWTVLFHWPMDFAVICPIELESSTEMLSDFRHSEAVFLGANTDTAYVRLVWRNNHEDPRVFSFPMFSDHA